MHILRHGKAGRCFFPAAFHGQGIIAFLPGVHNALVAGHLFPGKHFLVPHGEGIAKTIFLCAFHLYFNHIPQRNR